MLPRKVVSLNVLPYLAMLFNFVQSDNDSIALQRQLLFHHEPPFENHYYRKDNNVTEHFIKQRVDNFDHQNKETFQMVSFQETGFRSKYSELFKFDRLFSAIFKMQNISNRVDQFLFTLVVNGELARVRLVLENIFMI